MRKSTESKNEELTAPLVPLNHVLPNLSSVSFTGQSPVAAAAGWGPGSMFAPGMHVQSVLKSG